MMHRSRRQRGIALILVLWIMVLLTLMAAGFAFERRTDAVLAIDQIEAIEADALAEAAIARAVLALKQDDVELQPIPDGRIYPWRYAGRELRFAVVSENGKIDLNGAREELIHGLFSSLVGELEDFDQAQADALADAVLDWRDRDSDTRPSGAEDDDYRAAGYEYESADAPFVTIGELLRIKGMTEPVYSRVSDAVTVYTRSGQIDPLSAPRRALLAVPDTEAGLADKVIEARNARQSVLEPIPELRSWFGDGARFLTTGRPQTFSIYAQARTGSGYWIGRRAVVRLTADKSDPYTVIAWFDHADIQRLGTAVGDDQAGEMNDAAAGDGAGRGAGSAALGNESKTSGK